MGNKEDIVSLVDNYFGLDTASQEKFENKIHNPDIDEVYSQYLGEDFRARWKVPNEKLEEYDQGWKIFKNRFKVFRRDYGITYEDFRNNKKLVDKNYVKLRKLLKEYYLDKLDDELVRDIDLSDIPFYSGEEERVIDNFLDENYKEIGRVKLPKSGIDIVLSCNFEDWLFCSTGETWGSCLDLRSEYMYWGGLPGLVGDKNRAMIYVTDNRQKNPHPENEHFKVDRILSRSWVLLDENGVMRLVKFYPNQYFNTREIEDITGLYIEEGNWGNYRSKHPIDFLRFEGGSTVYPYQDTTTFTPEGYLEGGEKGHFFFTPSSDFPVQDDIFRHTEEGIQDLIENRKDLSEFERTFQICDMCGRTIEEGEEDFLVDVRVICEDCFHDHYFTCDICNEVHHLDDMIEIDGDMICSDCFEREYAKCDKCGEYYREDDILTVHIDGSEQNMCRDCAEEEDVTMCKECGVFHKKEEMHVDEYEDYFCDGCMRKFIRKKQIPLIEEAIA